jgi:hypothetical protein
MADEKIVSNGNIDVWIIPQLDLAYPEGPSFEDLIASGVRITPDVAWDGSTYPQASESNSVDDRSWEDEGNATTMGNQTFEAVLNLFRPVDGDNTSSKATTFELLRHSRLPVYIVTRTLQRETGRYTAPAAGQWVSVFKALSDAIIDDTEGEDSVKYAVNFLQQGWMKVYTQLSNAVAGHNGPGTGTLQVGPNTNTDGSGETIAVGAALNVFARLQGHLANRVVEWASSDPLVAEVTSNGVVIGKAAGTATISATHPVTSHVGTMEVTVS